jgi:hypothetical protein
MLIHYLQIIFGARSSQGERVVKWSLLAKLDRLAIGSILRSKLVFLINVHTLGRMLSAQLPVKARTLDECYAQPDID